MGGGSRMPTTDACVTRKTRPTGPRLQCERIFMIWWKFSLTKLRDAISCRPAAMRTSGFPGVFFSSGS